MRRLLAVTLLMLLPAISAAAEKPAELAPYIKAEQPYGQGSYRWTFFKAYDAALWTDAPVWRADSTYALSLTYNMHFTTEQLVECSLKEMQQMEALTAQQRGEYATQLAHLLPEVHKGDVVTAVNLPAKGAVFFYNGKRTGTLRDTLLVHRFFAMWLSDRTSAPELRKALLVSH